ncbi:MAG: hypothetical protein ACR5K9_04660 [Wolbachia sp.]
MVNVKFCVEECNVFDDYGKSVSRTDMTGEGHWDDRRGVAWMATKVFVFETKLAMKLNA